MRSRRVDDICVTGNGSMNVSPESVAAVVVIIVIVIVIVIGYFLSRRRSPKEKSFRCSRCSAVSQHTSRTINAWHAGKTKFFCGSCHSEWLRSHPAARASVRESNGGQRSGCLGVLACLIFIPITFVLAWLYASQYL